MFGLIGKKLSHSFSKEIHEKLHSQTYNLIELNQLDSFFQEKKFNGINVTIPYKHDVIKYLDVLSESAKTTGSVNTIINNNGLLLGYNTDFDGLSYLLEYHHISLKNKTVLILGNGATSRTVYSLCTYLGAKKVYISARNPKSQEYYFTDIDFIDSAQIIFNATPNGMYPNNNDDILIDLSLFKKVEAVVDLVYNPLRTKLLQKAESLGVKAVNGLLMLVHQAVKSCELFHNQLFDSQTSVKIYKELLLDRLNIVLIGMPMSGKSHYSRLLSTRYQKELYDIDSKIEETFNMPISNYFSIYGETSFRTEESKAIKLVSEHHNKIISTGGGSILKEINIQFLKQNGIIIFLDAPLDFLKKCNPKNRPLLKEKNSLENLYNERYQIYKKNADIIIQKDILDSNIIMNLIEVKINEYLNS